MQSSQGFFLYRLLVLSPQSSKRQTLKEFQKVLMAKSKA